MLQSIATEGRTPAGGGSLSAGHRQRPELQAPAEARRKPQRRLGRAVPLAACCLALVGCGKFFPDTTTTSTGGTSTTDHLYVANNNASLNTIAGFTLSSGALTATTSSPYLLGQTPSTLALTPSNSLLYVGSILAGIYVYTVNSDGSLTIANSGSPVANVSASSMAVDSTGNWLVVMQNQVTGSAPIVSVYSINTSTGQLTKPGNDIALDTGSAGQLLFIPSTTTTNLVYATLGVGGADALTFNTSTGTLTKLNVHLNTLGNAYSDNNAATNPAGSLLFISETGGNTVRSFTINAGGTLSEVSGSPFAAGLGVGALLVDTAGTHLYAANSAAASISAYTIGSSGALSAISGSPFATGTGPHDMVEDNTKAYLAVVCDGGTPDLEVFPFSSTVSGALGTAVTTSTGSLSPAQAYAVVASH